MPPRPPRGAREGAAPRRGPLCAAARATAATAARAVVFLVPAAAARTALFTVLLFVAARTSTTRAVVVAAFGTSLPVLILMAAISYVPGSYRFARALALDINAMDFIEVARARGERAAYVVWAEILPNMIVPLLTDFGLRFVFVVLLLSGLSFLGLGIQPPNADWGALVRENITGIYEAAPAVLVPAVAIAALTISITL